MNPHQITREFEAKLCEYTGAKFAVAVNSCTAALLLATKWNINNSPISNEVNIPKRTYVSVPQSIIHAKGHVTFRDEEWLGMYQLKPFPIWDSARFFSSVMYQDGQFQCVSFHTSKILGDSQGGAILHDNPEADKWFRKARFDGRTEGVAPKDDSIDMVGYHCYISPDVSARLLWKLYFLPLHNEPLPNDDYPDLSLIKAFQ